MMGISLKTVHMAVRPFRSSRDAMKPPPAEGQRNAEDRLTVSTQIAMSPKRQVPVGDKKNELIQERDAFKEMNLTVEILTDQQIHELVLLQKKVQERYEAAKAKAAANPSDQKAKAALAVENLRNVAIQQLNGTSSPERFEAAKKMDGMWLCTLQRRIKWQTVHSNTRDIDKKRPSKSLFQRLVQKKDKAKPEEAKEVTHSSHHAKVIVHVSKGSPFVLPQGKWVTNDISSLELTGKGG